VSLDYVLAFFFSFHNYALVSCLFRVGTAATDWLSSLDSKLLLGLSLKAIERNVSFSTKEAFQSFVGSTEIQSGFATNNGPSSSIQTAGILLTGSCGADAPCPMVQKKIFGGELC
jgi:hypothetical protein